MPAPELSRFGAIFADFFASERRLLPGMINHPPGRNTCFCMAVEHLLSTIAGQQKSRQGHTPFGADSDGSIAVLTLIIVENPVLQTYPATLEKQYAQHADLPDK